MEVKFFSVTIKKCCVSFLQEEQIGKSLLSLNSATANYEDRRLQGLEMFAPVKQTNCEEVIFISWH